MQFERPILKLIPSKFDKALDWISLAGILFLWVFTISEYSTLPAIIPTHFNFDGTIDDHGSPSTLFIIPAIITVVVSGLTALNNFPHIFNYMRRITPENAREQYTMATRLLRVIKTIITIFSIMLMFDTVHAAKTGHSLMKWWIIPIFMVLMIAPIFISFFLTRKKDRGGL